MTRLHLSTYDKLLIRAEAEGIYVKGRSLDGKYWLVSSHDGVSFHRVSCDLLLCDCTASAQYHKPCTHFAVALRATRQESARRKAELAQAAAADRVRGEALIARNDNVALEHRLWRGGIA